MFSNGFVKISRSILEWRWYCDANTFRVFFHLLLNANFKDGEFEKHTIKRGQIVTGRKAISQQLNISEQAVRTALEHLKSTNEITIRPTSKYSIITIENYELFQNETNNLTADQLSDNQQSTSDQPQYNKAKKNKKDRMSYRRRNASFSIEDFENKSLFKD